MSTTENKNNEKNMIRLFIGGVALVVGIALILAWWPDVASLFKGAIGIVLALVGMLVMYAAKK